MFARGDDKVCGFPQALTAIPLKLYVCQGCKFLGDTSRVKYTILECFLYFGLKEMLLSIPVTMYLSNKPYLVISQHLKDMTELCLLKGNLYKVSFPQSGSGGRWD